MADFAQFTRVQISDLASVKSASYHWRYRNIPKRIIDLTVSILILPAILPIIFVLATLVRHDGGPSFFCHQRIGRNGKPFDCLKIRTMAIQTQDSFEALLRHDERLAVEWKLRRKLTDDPRVTKIGRILRRTSLDELPQIWNVLKGEMSLIGPRPVTFDELANYGDLRSSYEAVRPGVTGLWQISGRNKLSYQARVELDIFYVQNLSFPGDIKILWKTLLKVLRPDGC